MPLYRLTTAKEQIDMFSNVMSYLIDLCLPERTVKWTLSDKPWVTDELSKLVALRQYHFHAGNKAAFAYYRNKVNRTRKGLQRSLYNKKMQNLKTTNPRGWWMTSNKSQDTNRRP